MIYDLQLSPLAVNYFENDKVQQLTKLTEFIGIIQI